ncbi:MAG: carboxypeptidase-like regulatory domain-containing protein [Acidimicrobiales bacterium]
MRAVVALVALALLAGACTDHDDADPSPDPDPTSSTSLSDFSGVDLPGVGGETTTTIEEKGTARLVGSVTGPSGPVAAATVRIDRLVAGRVVRHDVLTGPDGRWELRDVPGGRYRVRAFQPPTYAQKGAEVRFLADGEEHSFDLKVEDQRGVVVRADVAPDQPLLDDPVNLVVLVVQKTVTPDGMVSSQPVANAFVELTGLGRWVVRDDSSQTDGGATDDSTTTTFDDTSSLDEGAVLDGSGRARFELRCAAPGAPGLALRIPVLVVAEPAPPASGSTTTTSQPTSSTQEVALELPDCIDTRSTTTTTTSSSSTP